MTIRVRIIGRPTQREQILDMLRAAGSDGLCSLSAYRKGPHFFNARNRVSELGRDGYDIRSERCAHDEDVPSHVRWTLIHEPSPTQLTVWTERGRTVDQTSSHQRVGAAT